MKENKRALIQKFLASQNLDVSSQVLDVYESICEKYDYAKVNQALQRYIARSDSNYKFKPQTLRELLCGFSLDSLAHAQWQEVILAIQKVGPYHSVCFSHPVTNIVVSQIGWESLNSKNYQDLIFVEKDFKRAFEAEYQHYVRGKHPAVVVGSLDRNNMNKKDVPLFNDVRHVCTDPEIIQKVITSGIKPARPQAPQSLNMSSILMLDSTTETDAALDNKDI